MTADIVTTSHDFSSNSGEDSAIPLFDAESVSWMEYPGVIEFARTSPGQSDRTRYAALWQHEAIARFATSKGLPIVASYRDVAADSRTLGLKGRPQLFAAIEKARQTGCPILAFEYRRFTRQPRKLKQFSDVVFASLTPLSITDETTLNAMSRKAANQILGPDNPTFAGGRPPKPTSFFALQFIREAHKNGRSWTAIARDLGPGWSDNKVKRVFQRGY